MTKNDYSELVELLANAKRGIHFDEGLTDAEIFQTEKKYGFRFPLDLRGFLQTALPTGLPFADWRSADELEIRERLRTPFNGIMLDVEYNNFWLPEWGSQPTLLADARKIVESHFNKAPSLIPIYRHRMMPDRPLEAGNPVLSVHQTDIIYYGFNLEDYFRHEFGLPNRKPGPSEVRAIEFWDVDRWQDLRWR